MVRALLSLILALAVATGASAQTTTRAQPSPVASANPYSVTVPVAGTSDAQRNTAMTAALDQVLQQVSPGFAAAPDVLAQASGYVREYHYRRAASGGLELQVAFDPGAIGRVIAQGGGAIAGQSGAEGFAGARASAPGGSGTLWVGGIDNSHAFASVLSALRGNAALHDVIPVAAEGDGVMLRVTSEQPLSAVLAVLTGPTGHLAPAARPHPGADATLRWLP